MRSNDETLSKYIRLVDNRNYDEITSTVLGISIDKEFIPSVANVIGTDLSRYKLIQKGMFACNPMHVGRDERLPIALYSDDAPAIVSPAYFMFEVVDSAILDAEYLMMWFRRPELDRECWFMTDGSVRGGITWEDLCRIRIPVPSIEKQRNIVKAYKTITDRIAIKRKMNENLEAQAQAYFDKLFLSSEETDCTLNDISTVNPPRSMLKNALARCFEMACLPTKGYIPTGGELKRYNGGMRFKNGDTIIARITPCLENGKAAFINILDDNEIAFGSTEYVVFAPKGSVPPEFNYFLIRSNKFMKFALQYMNGSSGRQRVSGDELAAFPIKQPREEMLEEFNRIATPVMKKIEKSTVEIKKLQDLQELIVFTISNR